uniref:histone deacetylase n=1 Tax=Piliocolobus tephrosceles TaxID=591936 RepID=A0A8C9H4Q5_9PRIM
MEILKNKRNIRYEYELDKIRKKKKDNLLILNILNKRINYICYILKSDYRNIINDVNHENKNSLETCFYYCKSYISFLLLYYPYINNYIKCLRNNSFRIYKNFYKYILNIRNNFYSLIFKLRVIDEIQSNQCSNCSRENDSIEKKNINDTSCYNEGSSYYNDYTNCYNEESIKNTHTGPHENMNDYNKNDASHMLLVLNTVQFFDNWTKNNFIKILFSRVYVKKYHKSIFKIMNIILFYYSFPSFSFSLDFFEKYHNKKRGIDSTNEHNARKKNHSKRNEHNKNDTLEFLYLNSSFEKKKKRKFKKIYFKTPFFKHIFIPTIYLNDYDKNIKILKRKKMVKIVRKKKYSNNNNNRSNSNNNGREKKNEVTFLSDISASVSSDQSVSCLSDSEEEKEVNTFLKQFYWKTNDINADTNEKECLNNKEYINISGIEQNKECITETEKSNKHNDIILKNGLPIPADDMNVEMVRTTCAEINDKTTHSSQNNKNISSYFSKLNINKNFTKFLRICIKQNKSLKEIKKVYGEYIINDIQNFILYGKASRHNDRSGNNKCGISDTPCVHSTYDKKTLFIFDAWKPLINFNDCDDNKNTLIHKACLVSNLNLIYLLLHLNVNLIEYNEKYELPLHCTIYNCDRYIFLLLLHNTIEYIFFYYVELYNDKRREQKRINNGIKIKSDTKKHIFNCVKKNDKNVVNNGTQIGSNLQKQSNSKNNNVNCNKNYIKNGFFFHKKVNKKFIFIIIKLYLSVIIKIIELGNFEFLKILFNYNKYIFCYILNHSDMFFFLCSVASIYNCVSKFITYCDNILSNDDSSYLHSNSCHKKKLKKRKNNDNNNNMVTKKNKRDVREEHMMNVIGVQTDVITGDNANYSTNCNTEDNTYVDEHNNTSNVQCKLNERANGCTNLYIKNDTFVKIPAQDNKKEVGVSVSTSASANASVSTNVSLSNNHQAHKNKHNNRTTDFLKNCYIKKIIDKQNHVEIFYSYECVKHIFVPEPIDEPYVRSKIKNNIPENSSRLDVLISNEHGILKANTFFNFHLTKSERKACPSDLLRVHDISYLKMLLDKIKMCYANTFDYTFYNSFLQLTKNKPTNYLLTSENCVQTDNDEKNEIEHLKLLKQNTITLSTVYSDNGEKVNISNHHNSIHSSISGSSSSSSNGNNTHMEKSIEPNSVYSFNNDNNSDVLTNGQAPHDNKKDEQSFESLPRTERIHQECANNYVGYEIKTKEQSSEHCEHNEDTVQSKTFKENISVLNNKTTTIGNHTTTTTTTTTAATTTKTTTTATNSNSNFVSHTGQIRSDNKQLPSNYENMQNTSEIKKIKQLNSNSIVHKEKIEKLILLDNDTFVNKHSFNCALSASGTVLKAVDYIYAEKKKKLKRVTNWELKNGKTSCVSSCANSCETSCETSCNDIYEKSSKTKRNTNFKKKIFCVVRPPGHHLGTFGAAQFNSTDEDRAAGSQGFCILNNVAIGMSYAKYKYDEFKKIAIIDFDIHHGNGTEQIIRNVGLKKIKINDYIDIYSWKGWKDSEDKKNIFFSSIHAFDGYFYPGTGSDTVELEPYIINVTLKKNMNEQNFLELFHSNILIHLYHFEPDLLFLSAGFDGHKLDYVNNGFVKKKTSTYFHLTNLILSLQNKLNFPIISVLEGGYNTSSDMASVFSLSVLEHLLAFYYSDISFVTPENRRGNEKTLQDPMMYRSDYSMRNQINKTHNGKTISSSSRTSNCSNYRRSRSNVVKKNVMKFPYICIGKKKIEIMFNKYFNIFKEKNRETTNLNLTKQVLDYEKYLEQFDRKQNNIKNKMNNLLLKHMTYLKKLLNESNINFSNIEKIILPLDCYFYEIMKYFKIKLKKKINKNHHNELLQNADNYFSFLNNPSNLCNFKSSFIQKHPSSSHKFSDLWTLPMS